MYSNSTVNCHIQTNKRMHSHLCAVRFYANERVIKINCSCFTGKTNNNKLLFLLLMLLLLVLLCRSFHSTKHTLCWKHTQKLSLSLWVSENSKKELKWNEIERQISSLLLQKKNNSLRIKLSLAHPMHTIRCCEASTMDNNFFSTIVGCIMIVNWIWFRDFAKLINLSIIN